MDGLDTTGEYLRSPVVTFLLGVLLSLDFLALLGVGGVEMAESAVELLVLFLGVTENVSVLDVGLTTKFAWFMLELVAVELGLGLDGPGWFCLATAGTGSGKVGDLTPGNGRVKDGKNLYMY